MAAVRVEDSIRDETLEHLPRRVQALADALDSLGIVRSRPADVEREMVYLERVTASVRGAMILVDPVVLAQIPLLRMRVNKLKRANVGDLLGSGASHAFPESLGGQATHTHSLGGRSYTSGGKSWGQEKSFRSNKQSYGSEVSAVASFALPHLQVDDADNEVRIKAVEGKLVDMIGQYPAVTFQQQESSLIMRSWKEGDDGVDRIDFLEISKEAVTIRRVSDAVAQNLEEGQVTLNALAAETAQTRLSAGQAVTEVSGAAGQKLWCYNIFGILIAVLIILGGFVLWNVLGAIVWFIAAVALAVVVGAATCSAVRWMRTRVQTTAESMKPGASAWELLNTSLVERLVSEGREGERRLQTFLGKAWAPKPEPAAALSVSHVQSVARSSEGACAFRACFKAPLAAPRAFEVLERLRITGGLEPGCKAVSTRPVDVDTSVRRAVYSLGLRHREFFTVCRSQRLPTADGKDYFLCSSTSLTQELREELWDDLRSTGIAAVHAFGVCIQSISNSECSVDIVADIDPNVQGAFTDRFVRGHALATANEVQRAIHKAAVPLKPAVRAPA